MVNKPEGEYSASGGAVELDVSVLLGGAKDQVVDGETTGYEPWGRDNGGLIDAKLYSEYC